MFRVARRFLGEVREATRLQSYDLREELVLWDFRRAYSLREWSCISDRDMGGYSAVSLEPNGNGQKFSILIMLYTLLTDCELQGREQNFMAAWIQSALQVLHLGTAAIAPSDQNLERYDIYTPSSALDKTSITHS